MIEWESVKNLLWISRTNGVHVIGFGGRMVSKWVELTFTGRQYFDVDC